MGICISAAPVVSSKLRHSIFFMELIRSTSSTSKEENFTTRYAKRSNDWLLRKVRILSLKIVTIDTNKPFLIFISSFLQDLD